MAQDDIRGQVVDASGSPISGAIVELTKSYQSNPAGDGRVFRTTTDSNGNYLFKEHPDGDGTTQEWHVAAYSHDGTAYVNSFNNPGVTADLPNVIPDSDIAQFEDGSLHPSFSGDTGDYQVTSTSPTLTGTYSLKATVENAGPITSESGLDRYPQTDQRFACYVYIDTLNPNSGLPTVAWGTQDTSNFYEFGYVPSNDQLFLSIVQNGSFTELSSRPSVAVSSNTWYDLEIEWLSDGSITGRIFDVDQSTGDRSGAALQSISASDSTWSSGGLGFNNQSGSGFPTYDNYRVLEAL